MLVPYSTIPCRNMLYCTIPCLSVLYCTMPCWSALYCTLMHRTIPCWTVLYCTIPYWIVLCCTLPHHTIPYHVELCCILPYHAELCCTVPFTAGEYRRIVDVCRKTIVPCLHTFFLIKKHGLKFPLCLMKASHHEDMGNLRCSFMLQLFYPWQKCCSMHQIVWVCQRIKTLVCCSQELKQFPSNLLRPMGNCMEQQVFSGYTPNA